MSGARNLSVCLLPEVGREQKCLRLVRVQGLEQQSLNLVTPFVDDNSRDTVVVADDHLGLSGIEAIKVRRVGGFMNDYANDVLAVERMVEKSFCGFDARFWSPTDLIVRDDLSQDGRPPQDKTDDSIVYIIYFAFESTLFIPNKTSPEMSMSSRFQIKRFLQIEKLDDSLWRKVIFFSFL